jgi:hypothetical protein
MFLQIIWSFLNDISFLTILSLISIKIPGISLTISATILNFVQLDLLQTDTWLPGILYSDPDEVLAADPLNSTFDIGGYQTRNLIANLASTFIYLIIIAVMYFVLLMTFVLKRFSER